MTPNGAFTVSFVLIALGMSVPGPHGLAALVIFVLAFAFIEAGAAALIAMRRAAAVVLPLALFMGLVWVAIIGKAPAEIAAEAPGTRTAALLHVLKISGRLFLIVALLQLVFVRFAALTPLHFVRVLALPAAAKRSLVICLSLVGTLRHAIDRAHIALIAAGTLTRAPSLRNLFHAWRLIQAVWLSAITILLGRMRDKWPVEHTMRRLDSALIGDKVPLFSVRDLIWLPLTAGAAAAVLLADAVGPH